MVQRFCLGGLSEESKQRLQAEYASARVTTPVPCATCGRQVLAENKSGEWVTITHYPPLAVRPSKSVGAKRTMEKRIVRRAVKTGSTRFKKRLAKRGTKKTYKR